jgi:hypothetical protein
LSFGLLNGDEAFLPALWTDRYSRTNDEPTFLRGTAIGYRQSLTSGEARELLLETISDACRSISATCTRVGIDRVLDGTNRWLGCQGQAHEVGVYSDRGKILRRIDIRSPRFTTDYSMVSIGSPVKATVAWSQRNSTVFSCMSFGDYVATIHTTFEQKEWSPGVAMTPRVHMNIHSLDGTPVVADWQLPDYPIAKTADSLFLISYAEARGTTSKEISLLRVQVLDAVGRLATALRQPHTFQ